MRPIKNHKAAHHTDLVIGMDEADDAGVFSLGDGRVLIQTVDIFTPVVDDGRDWGRIAAANALSDIYAMGAMPLTALNYLAWPRDQLPLDVAGEVLAGGLDIMAIADCTVIGGHSIDSPEPTFGYAVTGVAKADEIVAISGTVPGDRLVLTKPLGIGIITTAIKRDFCPSEVARVAIEQMASLNERAGQALVTNKAHSATDVSGFGLLGHLREMCDASGVGARILSDQVSVIAGTEDLLARGAWAGGSKRNLESIADIVLPTEKDIRILADAQTSGGLLVALDSGDLDSYLEAVPGAFVIGEITERPGIEVR